MGDIVRRTYTITGWARWDHDIHQAVEDFRERLGHTPNLLLASEVTHARIDMAARKDNILGPEGELPDDGEYTPLAAFHGADYTLEFCIDDDVPEGRFSLIYDDDPDGDGGEPVPDDDTLVWDDEAETA